MKSTPTCYNITSPCHTERSEVSHNTESKRDFSHSLKMTKGKQLKMTTAYKPSRIEWLGEIPQSWEIKKCKFFFIIQNTIVGDLWNKTKLLSLTLNGVVERDINNPEGKFPSDFSTYQLVKRGNLVFCLFDVEETPRAIGLSQIDGMITSAYTVIKVVNQNERFLAYLFISLDNGKNLSFLYRGLRKTISKEDLLNLKIPIPPLQEQKEIAEFLDSKCEKIQNYIDKKQKLITLLQEKKQALINEAVCGRVACHTERSEVSTMESRFFANAQNDKGNISYKDSGIEYLGLIPHHWEVVKVKYIATTNIGLVYDPSEIATNENVGYPVLRANNIQNGKIDYKDVIYVAKKIDDKQLTISGDLLMCVRNGSENLLGKTAKIENNNFSFGAFTAIIRSDLNNYLYWIFQTEMLKKSISSFIVSIGIGQISQDDIKNFKIPLPPLHEQKEIAAFLDSKVAQINSAIEKTKKQIELVKEYKNTLINEAVCGRINF